MLKRLAAAIGLALLVWGTSCAGRLQKSHDHQKNEETNERWAKRAEHAEESKQHDEKKQTDTKVVFRRKTTPSPAGPIVEEEYAVSLSELQASSGVVRQRSDSESATGEAGKKLKEHDRGQVDAGAKTSLPWFRIGAGVVLAALVCYLVWRWRRRLRLG